MNNTTAQSIIIAMNNRGLKEATMPKNEPPHMEFLRHFEKGQPGEDWKNDLCMVVRHLSDTCNVSCKVSALTSPGVPRVTVVAEFFDN